MSGTGRVQSWSDGRSRRRHVNATVTDGHGRRALSDVYGVIVAHETATDDWAVSVSGEWSNLLDLAEAILAADRDLIESTSSQTPEETS